MKPDLSVTVCGIRHKNPIVVASATPSGNYEHMKTCVDAGAGGIIAKTYTPEPLARQYVTPRFTVLHKKGWPHNFSNYSCEFLAQYDLDDWAKELEKSVKYCHAHDVVLYGSLSGDTLENWKKMAKQCESTGVDALELNFGCPHPKDLGYLSGQELGNNPDAAAAVTKVVCDTVKIPVFCKLTSEAVNPCVVAEKCRDAGASGLTVINRFSALDIDLEAGGRPLLHANFAGVGGPWMRPILLKWLIKIGRAAQLPMSATSGIWGWEDVVKAIMCGASTVQTCTALMYGTKGYGMIQEYVDKLAAYMENHGYETIEQMRNITEPQVITWDEVDREAYAKHENYSVVDPDKCRGCGLCHNWCFRSAISYDERKKAHIDTDKCDGCGLCPSLCPASAIKLESLKPVYLGNFN